jgi:hypothetical protein
MSAFSGAQCVDDWGAQGLAGDLVGTWTCVPGAATQSWTLTPGGQLKGINGLCVQAPDAVGGQATLQYCNGSTAQQWSLGAGTAPTTPVAPTPGLPSSRFTASVSQVASGLCLSIAGNQQGNLVAAVLSPCAGQSGQQWSLAGVGVGGLATVYGGSACLDDWGAQGLVGDQLGTWSCVPGAPTQTWTLTSAGELRGVNDLCVGTRGSATASGALVELQACTGAATQKWTARPL